MPVLNMTRKDSNRACLFAALILSVLPCGPAQGQGAITNVRAAQRTGTNLVDIDYDVTGASLPLKITLEVSDNDGGTFAVASTSVSGAVGASVTPGSNLRLTWDAGADWGGHHSATMRFKVVADDSPVPAGFVAIPAGAFQMGDQSSPLVGFSAELPVHTVQVGGLFMGKYEVTKAEWDTVRAWGLGNGYTDLPAGGGKAANHPVHSISWYAAVKWCNARSQMDNLTPCYTVGGNVNRTGTSSPACGWSANGYRLPTEAEWEKAVRGGLSAQNFPWGDTINHSFANYMNSNYSYESPQNQGYHPTYNDGVFPYTSPVGSFAPNGYGLYDMVGNLWEWCWDWYGNYSAASQVDPSGAATGSNRVARGGSWNTTAIYSRSAYRGGSSPSNTTNNFGFRVVRRQP